MIAPILPPWKTIVILGAVRIGDITERRSGMKKHSEKTKASGASAALIRRFADRLPEKEQMRIAAQILETFGYICIPPEVVAKGKKKTG